MTVRTLFETELHDRHIVYKIDPQSGRHEVEIGGGRMLISLENLQRDFDRDGDSERVSRFVDSILSTSAISDSPRSLDQLYWCLEPNDYVESADFRVAQSKKVDRALVHLSADNRLVSWVTPSMLNSLGISESEAAARAFTNLGKALGEATVETRALDGVQLGFIGTRLPFKASLILAPNLKEIMEQKLGWPLMAVAPDRDFLYLWAARDKDFLGRVGGVVVREYSQASYPLSTEVWEITDAQIRAVGAFPIKS